MLYSLILPRLMWLLYRNFARKRKHDYM